MERRRDLGGDAGGPDAGPTRVGGQARRDAGARERCEARLCTLGEAEMAYIADRMSAGEEAWWTGRWRAVTLEARLEELARRDRGRR